MTTDTFLRISPIILLALQAVLLYLISIEERPQSSASFLEEAPMYELLDQAIQAYQAGDRLTAMPLVARV